MDGEIHKVMTPQEVADFLHFHKNTLYRLLKQNKIPGVFKVGSDYRFNREQIERWVVAAGSPKRFGAVLCSTKILYPGNAAEKSS